MSYLERLAEQIKKHEASQGPELLPYEDTTGHITIGYGRNLTDKGISEAMAEMMLLEDIEEAENELDRIFPEWVDIPSEARRRVLVDMMFNLGAPRYLSFEKFWAAMRAESYDTAADEMLDSRWAKQVGDKPGQRAHTLSEMMRHGA